MVGNLQVVRNSKKKETPKRKPQKCKQFPKRRKSFTSAIMSARKCTNSDLFLKSKGQKFKGPRLHKRC